MTGLIADSLGYLNLSFLFLSVGFYADYTELQGELISGDLANGFQERNENGNFAIKES